MPASKIFIQKVRHPLYKNNNNNNNNNWRRLEE